MTYVYLDTNIYNDIERSALPADDVRDFRAAVASGELVVRGSIVDLEESLGLWKEDRAAAQRRLHFFRELAGFDRLLNQPSDLLEGAIQAYAAGASMPSPLLPRRERLQVAAWLERIAAGDAKLDRIVDEILAGVRAQKESVQAGMNAGREKVVAELNSKYRPDELRAVQFEGFFEGGALGWAEDYAAPTGVVDECRKRGLEGLLQVRAVRLVVGMTMSLIHSYVFEGRFSQFSDAYDLWHAIQASAADVFVTRDDRFFRHLMRIPGVTGLRVVRSLREVLAESSVVRSR